MCVCDIICNYENWIQSCHLFTYTWRFANEGRQVKEEGKHEYLGHTTASLFSKQKQIVVQNPEILVETLRSQSMFSINLNTVLTSVKNMRS